MNKYSDALNFAKSVAKEAQKIGSRYFRSNIGYSTKSDGSPVTIADQEINHLVIDMVREQFPEHGILGEEQSWQSDRKELWICDPIDGTIAFAMGDPTSMFSLALVEDGDPIVGVTCEFSSDRMFWATKCGGAYLNDKPLHVSSRSMEEAWLAFPTNLDWIYSNQEVYEQLTNESRQTNIIHGGVFKGMLIAEGLSDGSVWTGVVNSWDMAAVKLIVEESGGIFTDSKGANCRLDADLTEGVLISNGVIHESILRILDRSS